MTDTSCHPLTGEEINSERHRLQGTTGSREEGRGDDQASPHQRPTVLGRKRGFREGKASRLGRTVLFRLATLAEATAATSIPAVLRAGMVPCLRVLHS